MHPIPTALFDISGPILRLSRVNRPGFRKRMVGHRTTRSWGGHFAAFFCANRPKEILANLNRQFFAQNRQILRKQATHGAGRSCVSRHFRRILWAHAVSGRNVTGRWNLFCIKWQMTNSPCHVSATHSRCSKNPPAVPRHTIPPGAVYGLLAQNLSVLRKKLPTSICKKIPLVCLRKICGGMPSSTSYSFVADHTFAQPRPIHSW